MDRESQPGRPRKIAVVLNRGGRVLDLGEPAAVAERVQAAFAAVGVEAEVAVVKGPALPRAIEAARDRAKRGEIDAVVVGGGDGTMGCAAARLAGTGIAMGALPLGTLNHFAKDLGMPLEIEAAAAAIAQGTGRRIDIAEVNGTVFVNNAIIGVYPYMVADRERRRRRHGIGKWAAMAMAFTRMLLRFPRRRLRLSIAGKELSYRTPLLVVGVNAYEPDGLSLRRKGGLAGGKLWLLVAQHQSAWGFLRFALRTVTSGLDHAGDFDVMEVTEATVHLEASRVPVAHDGEVDPMRGPLAFTIRPGDLLVLAPEPADATPA